jgi:glycosyltransferase involved in cell wall biosynthesis
MTKESLEISVIIPTFNRGSRLRECLHALTKQTFSSFEVIVVVDGSTDNTIELLKSLDASFLLTVIHQENSGQNIARNTGVKNAKGRYCLFIDDDILTDPDLVLEHFKVQRETGGVVGIGQIKMKIPKKADQFTRSYATGWDEHYLALANGTSPIWLDLYGGNFSIPRDLFLRSGGFANDLRRSHDIEFGYRLEQMGVPFVYIHNAIGVEDEQKRTIELMQDAEKSGAAWVNLYQRHPPVLPLLLGYYCEAGHTEILLRNILLFLNFPPYLLSFLGNLFIFSYPVHKWHRFILSYCYWRGVKRAITDKDTWNRLTHGVKILTYHAIGGPREKSSAYILPVKKFKKQMGWLKKRNFNVISLEEYLNYRQSYRLPPARSVIITFDDGYADNRKYAYPILRSHGFCATIFLVLGRINQKNDWAWDKNLIGRLLLSWDEILEMNLGGISFGVHSRTHKSLTSAPEDEVCAEIAGTRFELEQRLKTKVRFFAFPFGEFDEKVIELVKKDGFEAGLNIEEGVNTPITPLYSLRREMVIGTDSIIKFLKKVL